MWLVGEISKDVKVRTLEASNFPSFSTGSVMVLTFQIKGLLLWEGDLWGDARLSGRYNIADALQSSKSSSSAGEESLAKKLIILKSAIEK